MLVTILKYSNYAFIIALEETQMLNNNITRNSGYF